MRNKPDKLMWVAQPQGKFIVRSAYVLQQAMPNSADRTIWRKLQGMKMHEILKMLMWRIAQNILPTRSRLQEMGQMLDARCPLWFGCRWNMRIDN